MKQRRRRVIQLNHVLYVNGLKQDGLQSLRMKGLQARIMKLD